ncbi:MAG: XdhC family protein [Myxococcota bacterium]
MKRFWTRLEHELQSHDRAFIALVLSHRGSSPGTAGAGLIYVAGSDPIGTIGGGRMEAALLQAANDNDRPGLSSELLVHRPGTAVGTPSGLICAGEQTLLSGWVGGDDRSWIKSAAVLERDDAEGWVVFDGAPRVTEAEPSASLFMPLRIRRRVLIAGGGHCGAALAKLCDELGYFVTLVDIDAGRHTFRRCGGADRKQILASYKSLADAVTLPEHTRLIVMTSELTTDVDAIEGAHGIPFAYRGVMGSPAKLAAIARELSSRGVSLDGFCAPIGLAMKSDTPTEIAVSVAAQLLREDAP